MLNGDPVYTYGMYIVRCNRWYIMLVGRMSLWESVKVTQMQRISFWIRILVSNGRWYWRRRPRALCSHCNTPTPWTGKERNKKQAEGEIERKARVIPDESLDSCCPLAFPFLLLIAPNWYFCYDWWTPESPKASPPGSCSRFAPWQYLPPDASPVPPPPNHHPKSQFVSSAPRCC